MSQHTHTPGPWKAEPSGIRLGGANFGAYYVFGDEGVTIAKTEHAGDAALIAAAPELADALRKAWRWLDALSRSPYISQKAFMDCMPNDFGRGVISDLLARAEQLELPDEDEDDEEQRIGTRAMYLRQEGRGEI